jgi:hypothetical protein
MISKFASYFFDLAFHIGSTQDLLFAVTGIVKTNPVDIMIYALFGRVVPSIMPVLFKF